MQLVFVTVRFETLKCRYVGPRETIITGGEDNAYVATFADALFAEEFVRHARMHPDREIRATKVDAYA